MANQIVKGENKFYIGADEQSPIAEITYTVVNEETIIVDHTYVSEELRGQGIAGKLVKVITDFAREQGVQIIPLCPYVKTKMEGTKAYHDLIAEET